MVRRGVTREYVAVWPVVDEDATTRELFAAATRELRRMAQASGVRLIGDPVLGISDGSDGRPVVVARVPAEPVDELDDDRVHEPSEAFPHLPVDVALREKGRLELGPKRDLALHLHTSRGLSLAELASLTHTTPRSVGRLVASARSEAATA